MGFQHGKLLSNEIKENIQKYLSKDSPGLQNERSFQFYEAIDLLLSHLPGKYLQELKGVADGAQVDLKKIILLNLFPEMFHCSAITAKESATKDSNLYHVRVLDYSIGKGLQNSAVIIVQKPNFANHFISVSYAGFVGVVSGMNDQKISIGEIGAKGYGNWDGVPMTFIMREILENTSSSLSAKKLLSDVKRTCQYFYIVADGKTKESFTAFASQNEISFIGPGDNYKFSAYINEEIEIINPFFKTTNEKILTNQIVYKKTDDNIGTILNGQPNDILAVTGFNYKPYPILHNRLMDHYGKIDEKNLIEIIKAPVARDSNLHNVIFSPCDGNFWLAHAGENNAPAYGEKYYEFNIFKLLQR